VGGTMPPWERERELYSHSDFNHKV
jgi:hypothetical protein